MLPLKKFRTNYSVGLEHITGAWRGKVLTSNLFVREACACLSFCLDGGLIPCEGRFTHETDKMSKK